MTTEEFNFEPFRRLITEQRWDELRNQLLHLDPADMADFLEELDSDQRERVFETLDVETASDVLVELEPGIADRVVGDLDPEQIADLMDQMAPDDAARFLTELDEPEASMVLAAMQEHAEVRGLLQHQEDSAGQLMTPEFVAFPPTVSVGEARRQLAARDYDDPVLNVYVLEPETNVLIGLVGIIELYRAATNQTLGLIAKTDFVACHVSDDQEEVAQRFRKYDLWVMPVLDINGRMMGRITADDIMDVLYEEADQDLARRVGAPDIEEEEESPLRIARLRFPWLMITLIAGLVNSIVIKSMMSVTNVVAIAIFVPVILAMGGNTGMQSSAVAVRGIALGRKNYHRLRDLVWREVRVGICLGVSCALITGTLVWSTLVASQADTGDIMPGKLAGVVALAICNAMIFGSTYGAIVPIVLHRLHVDPAVAAGPFVTTSNDLSASLIYFLTCLLLLGA